MRRCLQVIWDKAEKFNSDNILSLLEYNSDAVLLDCGCGDGEITLKVALIVGIKKIYGIEIVNHLIGKAKQKGILVKQADLNSKFPFDADSVDAIHANQVIEHLFDSDNFVSEVYRILKRGVRCDFY